MSDPYAGNVVLLLPCVGVNNGTKFTDCSPIKRTVTRTGNAVTKTDVYKYYGSSGYFDGSADYLSIADSDDFTFGYSDFTLEAWIRPQSSTATIQGIIAQRYSSTGNHSFSFWTQTSGTLAFEANDNSFTCYSNGGVVPLNTWSHVAACRSGNKLRLFVNGVVVKEQAITDGLYSENQVILVGRGSSSLSNTDFKGHISDLRVTKGVARYVADFTPPDSLLSWATALETSLADDTALIFDEYGGPLAVDLASTSATAAGLSGYIFDFRNAEAVVPGEATFLWGPRLGTLGAVLANDASAVSVDHVPPIAVTLGATTPAALPAIAGISQITYGPLLGALAGSTAAISAQHEISATLAITLPDTVAALTGNVSVSASHVAGWRMWLRADLSAVWSIPLRPPRHVLSWGDLAVVRALRVHHWADSVVPRRGHTASWSDTSAPRASLDAPWSNVATVAPEHVAFWDDGIAPRLSFTLAWSDRSRASRDHVMGWGDGELPSATHQAAWGDVSSPRRAHQATWADTASALTSHTLAWADAHELRVSLALPWSDRAQALSDLVSPWQDAVPLAPLPLVVSWSDRAQARVSMVLTWGDGGSASREQRLTWGDNPVTRATHASIWADRAHGSQQVQAAWADAVAASRGLQLAWSDQAGARRVHQASWGACPAIQATHAAVYADREAASSAHAAIYADREAASCLHAAAWSGQVGLHVAHGGSWSLTATGRRAHAASWTLEARPVARADAWGRWALLENLSLVSISNVPEVLWNGQALAIHGARLSMDEDSPVWLAEEIELADLDAWGAIQLGDTIQFRVMEETWTLRVDGKGMSRPQVGELRLALSAVSPLAWLDAPYAAAITLDNSEGQVSAQATVAALVASVGVLRWELDDWLIPAGALAMSETTPLQAAREIVAALGGLLESDPDGTPVARQRHPVTVPEYAVATPDHVILDADLFAFQVSAAPSAGFNRVVISNEDLSGSDVTDRMEYLDEDGNKYDGEMRAWPNPWRPVTLGHTGHPETQIEALGARSHAHTELVEFVAGRGRTDYPVQAITGLTWQHADLGSVSASGTDLTAASAGQSLAWVTYTSLSLDWRVALARDEAVQFVLL